MIDLSGALQQEMYVIDIEGDVSDGWLRLNKKDGEYYICVGEGSYLGKGKLEVDGVFTQVRPSSFHVCFYSWGITESPT